MEINLFYGTENELSEQLDAILTKLVYETKWRRSRKLELLQRIRKIAADTTFSVRDGKLLKRLVMKQLKDGEISFGDLLYYFPGKTADMLEKQYALEDGPAL